MMMMMMMMMVSSSATTTKPSIFYILAQQLGLRTTPCSPASNNQGDEKHHASEESCEGKEAAGVQLWLSFNVVLQ